MKNHPKQIDLKSWKMTSTEERSSGFTRSYELVCRHHGVTFDIYITANYEFDGDADDEGRPIDASRWYMYATIDYDGAIALAADKTFAEMLLEVDDIGCMEDAIDQWEDWLNDETEREPL